METEDDFELAERLLEAIDNGDTEAVKKIRASMDMQIEIQSVSEAPKKSIQASPKYSNGTIVSFSFNNEITINSRDLGKHGALSNWITNGTALRGAVIDCERVRGSYSYYVEAFIVGNNNLPPIKVMFKILEDTLNTSDDQTSVYSQFPDISNLQNAFIREEEDKLRKIKEEKEKKERENIDKVVNDRIAEVELIAEEIHPDCWDFAKLTRDEFRSGSNPFYRLTIHFPIIDLSNGRLKHILRDLYVTMFFNEEMKHCSSWYGARGTISHGEMRSNYRHSHLRTSSGPEYSNFCLGSGTDTQLMVSGLQADGWNPKLLTKSLILMYGYVAWESIDGGPYIKIQDINSGDQTIIVNPTEMDKKAAYDKFIDTMDVFPVQFINSGNINSFAINEKDEEFETLVSLCTDMKVIKTVDGNYINKITNSVAMKRQIEDFNRRLLSTNDYNNSSRIKYKNTYITTKCVENIEENENSTLVAAPQITEFIARKLEEEMNIYKLKIIADELS